MSSKIGNLSELENVLCHNESLLAQGRGAKNCTQPNPMRKIRISCPIKTIIPVKPGY